MALIDRRTFVRRAGMVAAGSALGFSSTGCGADVITSTVPCLARVDAPAALPGMTYLKASEIGCALNCDLTSGLNTRTGGAATDDAPVINAAMAGASAANPITLIIDGPALISGLFLPAGGYWSIAGLGCGTGFFIKTGTNNDGIHNGGPKAAVPSDPGPNVPLPTRGRNVSLSNFTINGNQGNGTNGDSTTGATQGSAANDLFYFCINLMNLNNITITNVVVVNSPSYHIRFSNTGNVAVTGCVMDSTGPNTDGLHFDGPANDIVISGCSITCQDDGIALNCPEGYTGNISRVTISDCTFNTNSLARLYTISTSNSPYKFTIDTVTVSNCSGTFLVAAFMIGQGSASAPNSVGALNVSNCQLTTPTVLDISANFGAIDLDNVTMTPLNANIGDGLAFARTSGYYVGLVYAGSSLTFENCTMLRNSNNPVAAVIIENGSSIGLVEFDGFALQDPTGSAYPAAAELVDIVSGSIGSLVIDTLSTGHIASPVNLGAFATIGSVSGKGVLATAWPFPDSVMANGVPYISATTNQPSIKVGGVVEPYP
jgi:hypothetical protein